jgi:hypothetical protein
MTMGRIIWLLAFMGIFLACSNTFAEVEEVKVDLELNKECVLIVKYTNRSKEVLNGTLTLNINAGMGNRKEITDHTIDLAPGKTDAIDTELKVSGEAWVFVQTSFSGAGTGTAILVPVDKTLKCPE